jgi:Carboxypeptidase regulatory-like domain
MFQKAIRFLLLLLAGVGLTVTLCTREVNAQVLYGSITGTVSDQSGAVIPNAQVSATNDQTGLKREATSDTAGQYRILDLPQGTYTISVTASGFQAYKKTSVEVTIGQVNQQDLQLTIGAQTQEVTVQGSVAVLQTQKADVHTEITSYAVQNLPLSAYRNFQAAQLLAPGVFSTSGISNSYPNSIADTPERSFEIYSNGLPAHDNTTRVDGATNIFIWLPDHMLVVPPQESIEEVNVQTANYDVEKGLTAGAAVDVVTKSGSNQLHGSLYGFHTDDALNARNWYNHGSNTGTLNNDGVAIGGPIKKDKLFFFANWDGSWQHQAEGFTDTIPDDAMRAGNFSEYLGAVVPGQTVCTTEGATVPLQQGMIFDPTTGVQSGANIGENRCVFSSGGQLNVIPSDRVNSGSTAFWGLLKAEPNINQGLITTSTPYNYIGSKAARPLNRQIYTGRIDWNQSQNHTIWGKWSIQDANFFEPFDLGDAGGNGSGTAHQFAQVGTIGHTWTLSPTLVLTGHIGFDRMSEFAHPPGYGQPLGQSVLGIAGTNTPDGDIRYTGLPGINIQGLSGMGSLNSWEPDTRNDWTFTTSHNLSWIRGAHEFRMGVDIAHNHLNAFQPEIFCCPRGNVITDYGGTALNTSNLGVTLSPFVQNATALFDLGMISEAQNDAQFIKSTGKDTQMAFYFGDRWKVTPKLTADLGVRWEYFPLIIRDGEDKGELFDTATGQLHFGGLGGNPPHNGMTSSKTLFMPRVGLAYQINLKTVVRAGFGMSDDTTPLERPLRGFFPLAIGADNFDTSNTAEASACAGQASGATCFLPVATFAQGVPVIGVPDLSTGTITPPSNVDVGTLGPGAYHRGYVESWNLFVERQLPSDFLLSAGYVGNHYVHEFNGRDLNAAPLYGIEPSYGGIQRGGGTYQFQGYLDSHYNSLQVSLSHRSAHGLYVQAAYTYSKAMGYVNDNTWENGLEFNCPPSTSMPQGCQQLNYGPLSFDHTQTLKLAFVYDLPFGAGKRWANSRAANGVLGGWKLNGVFTAFTGAPLQMSQDISNIATYDTSAVPLHVTGIQYLGGGNNSAGVPQWFNSTAFVPNESSTLIGNINRTQSWLRGPGLWQFDPSLARIFKLTERFKLEVRAEAENVFNTPHFQSINTGCTLTADPSGGPDTCGTALGTIGGSYGQRLVQFGAFIRF